MLGRAPLRQGVKTLATCSPTCSLYACDADLGTCSAAASGASKTACAGTCVQNKYKKAGTCAIDSLCTTRTDCTRSRVRLTHVGSTKLHFE